MSATGTGTGATTEDVFLGGLLTVEQSAKGFRAGLDAVLLAAAVEARRAGPLRVLDVGAGVGTAGLCVAARLPGADVTLVERDAGLAGLARANIGRNGLGGRAGVVEADVLSKAAEHEAVGLLPGCFDIAICNPPYLAAGRSSLPADAVAAGAFGMPPDHLERWVRFMARLVTPGGEMIMIHRADALAGVLAAIGPRFGGLTVLPVHARPGTPAIRIIVAGIKGSRAPLQLLAGLLLHGDGNAFTPPVEAILKHGAALRLR